MRLASTLLVWGTVWAAGVPFALVACGEDSANVPDASARHDAGSDEGDVASRDQPDAQAVDANVADASDAACERPPSRVPEWFEGDATHRAARVHAHTILNQASLADCDASPSTCAFNHAEQVFKDLGLSVYTRYVKTGNEFYDLSNLIGDDFPLGAGGYCVTNAALCLPWMTCGPSPVCQAGDGRVSHASGKELLWRSSLDGWNALSSYPGGGIPDRVSPFTARAKSMSLSTLGYYWISADLEFARQHPDAACRKLRQPNEPAGPSANLAPGNARGGLWLDLSMPEVQAHIEGQLKELAKLGVRGFYFDYMHLPPTGCFGTKIERDFVAKYTSAAMPAGAESGPTNYTKTVEFKRYLEFQADQLSLAFASMRGYLKSDPDTRDAPMVVSSTHVGNLTYPAMAASLGASADASKTEWRLWDQAQIATASTVATRLSLAQTTSVPTTLSFDRLPPSTVRGSFAMQLLRDAAHGGHAHIWSEGMRSYVDANTASSAQQKAYLGAVVTGGNIAAPQYVPEYLSLPRVEQAPPTSAMYPPNRASAEDGIAFGIKLSAAITGTYPLRTFGVLYGESLKRTYDTSEDAWKAVLWPTVSAHWALRRMGLPSGVVTEDELRAGAAGVDVLLVAPTLAGHALPADVTAALARFTARGGTLVTVPNDFVWVDETTTPLATLAARVDTRLTPLLTPYLSKAKARVLGPSSDAWWANLFASECDRTVVVGLTNNYGHLQQASEDWQSWKRVNGACPSPAVACVGATFDVPRGAQQDCGCFTAPYRDAPAPVLGLQIRLNLPSAPVSVKAAIGPSETGQTLSFTKDPDGAYVVVLPSLAIADAIVVKY